MKRSRKLTILTCCSMFCLFLGISSANGIHIANIDLIRKHWVVRHSFKLHHTVTKIILKLFQSKSRKEFWKRTLVGSRGIGNALGAHPRGWYQSETFCSSLSDVARSFVEVDGLVASSDWLRTGQVPRVAEGLRDETGGQKGAFFRLKWTRPLWSTW